MFIATVIFWMGRKKMVHIPPAGLGFLRDLKSKEGLSILARVWIIFAFTMIFWALWDQSSGGEWTVQCQHMELHFLGLNFLPEQVNAVNGLFILAMIPLFNYWLYPSIDRIFPISPARTTCPSALSLSSVARSSTFPYRANIMRVLSCNHRSMKTSRTPSRSARAERQPSHG